MDDDWLQLTEEDIDRAHMLTRRNPPAPDVLTITSDDIPAAEPPAAGQAVISITADDLAPQAPLSDTSEELRQLEYHMFQLLNGARREHLPRWLGTAHLTWHDGLAAVARGHSLDMLRRQYVAHVSPEGVTVAQRIEGSRIAYVACGENIGVFYGEAAGSQAAIDEIHQAFMNQPRSLTNHRGNILNPVWTHVGIGIAYNPDGSLVVSQNFISAPGRRLRGQ
ncbi:MAG: CAP domain-containing protein [Chloroflexota bacterium]|jgi:uncharacterized protein YkwD